MDVSQPNNAANVGGLLGGSWSFMRDGGSNSSSKNASTSSFAIDPCLDTNPPPESSPELEFPLPRFLRQTRAEIHLKFVDLEWQQRERLHQSQLQIVGTTCPSSRVNGQGEDSRGTSGEERNGLGEGEGQEAEWMRMSGDEIIRRNRYMNVDPWAHNRVRLAVPKGKIDYINASPIRYKTSEEGTEKYFIATQGPKKLSTPHLWRMIAHETATHNNAAQAQSSSQQHRPAVIIMLTQTHESGREKCHAYYPADMSNPVLTVTDNCTCRPSADSATTTPPITTANSSDATDATNNLTGFKGSNPPTQSSSRTSSPPPTCCSSTSTGQPLPPESCPADGFSATLTLHSLRKDPATRCTVREMTLRATTTGVSTQSGNGGEGERRGQDEDFDMADKPEGAWEVEVPVVHLLFCGWPDFLVPEGEDRDALVRLVRSSRELAGRAGPSGPVPRFVHCSAGVGRSGTFIALDCLMQEMEEGAWDCMVDGGGDRAGAGESNNCAGKDGAVDFPDPVVDIVDRLRRQRMMMVQGEGQFVFLYEILRGLWGERWRSRGGEKGGGEA